MTDPLAQNAEATRRFFDEHSSPDRLPFQPGASPHVVLPDPVETIERDADDRVVSLILRPPA